MTLQSWLTLCFFPPFQALIHGLNRHYYSIPIKYRMNERWVYQVVAKPQVAWLWWTLTSLLINTSVPNLMSQSCSREQQMLLNLHKKSWMEGLTLQNYNEHSSLNEDTVKEILNLATAYNKVKYKGDWYHCSSFIYYYCLFIYLCIISLFTDTFSITVTPILSSL